MIIINSINFENLIVCLAENYHPDNDIPMNTTELTTFSDPLYFNGKEIIILTAEDEDIEDLMTMIDDDPITATTTASLMHRIALEMVTAVTKNHISDLLAGDWSSGESLVDFYKTQEPGFDHEVWEHAVHEAKVRVMTMLER